MTGAPLTEMCPKGSRDCETMADDAGRLNQVFAETSFLYGSNAAYIEELHEKWANDPGSVSAEWKAFFDQLRDNAASVKASAEAGACGRACASEPGRYGHGAARRHRHVLGFGGAPHYEGPRDCVQRL